MGEHSDFRRSDRDGSRAETDEAEPFAVAQSLQEIAHDRGRICKKRGCVVCAPLVEARREKKKQRREKARARRHLQGQPCGQSSCAVDVCVAARDAPAPPAPSRGSGPSASEPQVDPDQMLRRQAERHRVDLPCGSEDCPAKICVEGFAKERTRRHRAGRACRAASCDNAICVSGAAKR